MKLKQFLEKYNFEFNWNQSMESDGFDFQTHNQSIFLTISKNGEIQLAWNKYLITLTDEQCQSMCDDAKLLDINQRQINNYYFKRNKQYVGNPYMDKNMKTFFKDESEKNKNSINYFRKNLNWR